MTLEDLRRQIVDGTTLRAASFTILSELCSRASRTEDPEEEQILRELTIRVLEEREQLDGARPILDSLVHRFGLYPYLDPRDLDPSALIAFEAHRPADMPDSDLVFHTSQAAVYRHLLDGHNVILSAPTSYGKSLIIDALVASRRFRNIVIVVPTLALIDETRRRLSRFRDMYKVITHSAQEMGERNLFVMTQERVVDHPSLPDVDFFVIDEFYKLSGKMDTERSDMLNQALYKLLKLGRQFYFLGPSIRGIPPIREFDENVRFIKTDYSTVAVDVTRVSTKGTVEERLVDLCRELREPTLIYCRSPNRTRRVARWLLEHEVTERAPDLDGPVGWIADNFHPDWLVGQSLSRGIGIHHGRLPRALAQYVVRAFNEDKLRFLICTSTLIEGVNTKAKNVVIFDNMVAKEKFDYFTFNNIRGRSGRMFHHFVGKVFLFHEPPEEELPLVDIPVLTQSEDAPPSLLVQIDENDWTEQTRERLKPVLEQDVLPLSLIRANAGLDPMEQVKAATELRARASYYGHWLSWRGNPDYDHLKVTCEVLWNFLGGARLRGSGAYSASQLTFKVAQLRPRPSIQRIVAEELLKNPERDPDEVVEEALGFARQWAGHHFPRLLSALDLIQRHVFSNLGYHTGDYSAFVAQVENLFFPAPLLALDEYGVPLQVARKLEPRLVAQVEVSLDSLLTELRRLDPEQLNLSPFEQELIRDTQRTL
jgi:hypothetical protein